MRPPTYAALGLVPGRWVFRWDFDGIVGDGSWSMGFAVLSVAAASTAAGIASARRAARSATSRKILLGKFAERLVKSPTNYRRKASYE